MHAYRYRISSISALATILLSVAGIHPAHAVDDVNFSDFSFEELLDVVVTSVSKKEQKIGDAAAAVYVISQDDLRRSGATSVAEALRMVPGLQVARINAHAWAVSARGFNDYFANKLLVMVDGRTVYTPEFSGVYWDSVGPPLDDIERIEVIRGPGGTLWGANAVNGVINIITKSADDSQGTLLVAGAGDEEKIIARLRHGGKVNDKINYRVYATHNNRDAGGLLVAEDGWRMSQAGFRFDGKPSPSDAWSVQGDTYKNSQQEVNSQTLRLGDASVKGSNILGRWEHQYSENSDMSLQGYYDFYERDLPVVDINNHTFDLDFQHRYGLNEKHELLWGLGYRRVQNNIPDGLSIKLDPAERGENLWSAFVQDEIKLIPDKLVLTLGSKFEHNGYSGFEVQPNVRFMWTPSEKTSVWGSLSRAVHTPSRADQDVFIEVVIPPGVNPKLNPSPLPLVSHGIGSKEVDSDDVISYELGIRSQSNEKLSWDATMFFNVYDKILSSSTSVDASLSQGPFILVTQQPVNAMRGNAFGLELLANWIPKDWWRLQLGYSFLKLDLELYNSINSQADVNTENEAPEHTVSLRSSMDLNKNWQLDVWLRHVSELKIGVDSYTTMDMRIGWKIAKGVELSLVGQNLLEKEHIEYLPTTFNPLNSIVERSFYAQLRWELE